MFCLLSFKCPTHEVSIWYVVSVAKPRHPAFWMVREPSMEVHHHKNAFLRASTRYGPRLFPSHWSGAPHFLGWLFDLRLSDRYLCRPTRSCQLGQRFKTPDLHPGRSECVGQFCSEFDAEVILCETTSAALPPLARHNVIFCCGCFALLLNC